MYNNGNQNNYIEIEINAFFNTFTILTNSVTLLYIESLFRTFVSKNSKMLSNWRIKNNMAGGRKVSSNALTILHVLRSYYLTYLTVLHVLRSYTSYTSYMSYMSYGFARCKRV